MRHWKKGLLAAVCAALLLGLLAPASGSTSGVYLMAVNERMLSTNAENMPWTVGGVLYVPYTMLSNQVNGINLGVSALYSTTRRTVLVTDGRRGVTFDIQSNTAQDLNGTPVSARAMVRNTMVFLPIDWVCQYFGIISCSRTSTPYGTLIRVTNSAVILSDLDFVDAADASGQLSDSLRGYLDAINQGGEEDPTPSSSVAVTEPPGGAELYLALRTGTAAGDCAQLLEARGQRALFLFTEEELAREDDLVRRIVGAGHTVGLALTGEDLESCLDEARRGRALLAAAARYNGLVVSAPGLDREGRRALEEEGYVIWSTTVRGQGFGSGSALLRGLDTRQVNFVEITCSAGGLSLLRSALNAMEEENCQLYQANAPALS